MGITISLFGSQYAMAEDERWDQEMIREVAAWSPLLAKYWDADSEDNWLERRKALEAIVTKHANSQWVDDAQLALACGMAVFENDISGAIKLLDRVIADYPDASTIIVGYGPGFGYELDRTWLESQGSLVFLNDDGTVRVAKPFDRNGKIGDSDQELLTYFEHMRRYPRKTTVVAKLLQASMYLHAKQEEKAIVILDGVIADARKTLAATAAADRKAAQGKYGWYIYERLQRPEYDAWITRARLLAKSDARKSTELILELTKIVSSDGWCWEINELAGTMARQNKQEANAIEQYELAAKGLKIAIEKDRNRPILRLPPAKGSENTPTPLEQRLSDVQKKIAK